MDSFSTLFNPSLLQIARDEAGKLYTRDNFEFEARIRNITKNSYNIDYKEYNQVFMFLKSHKGLNIVHSNTTDEIANDGLWSIRKTTDNTTGNITYSKKMRIKTKYVDTKDLENIGVNLSMNIERAIESIKIKPDLIRNKNRTSFIINDIIRIDMTIITRGNTETQNKTYEIEIELIGSLTDINYDIFKRWIYGIVKVFQNTSIIYDRNQTKEVSIWYNSIFNGSKSNDAKLDPKVISQARDLEMNDLSWNTMVETPYDVTYKTDGVHKVLVVGEYGMWMIYSPYYYNFLLPSEITLNIFNNDRIVLDGEWIEETKTFWVFDTIFATSHNDTYVQTLDHLTRMIVASEFIERHKDVLVKLQGKIKLKTKAFYQTFPKDDPTAENFFKTMRLRFRSSNVLDYETDGLIFTPIYKHYNYLRATFGNASVLKWKPLNQLTIDFLIKRIPNTTDFNIYVIDKINNDSASKSELIIYTGNDFFPFSGRIKSTEMIKDAVDGSIYEFSYNENEKTFTPTRIRLDKVIPNNMKQALITNQLIHDPITEELLSGDTFKFMRRYHNKLKKMLFNSVCGNDVLLDIGSGRGGDAKKWENFRKIYAVEPDSSNIDELEKRVEMFKLKNKTKILKANGEDHTLISNFMGKDKANVIALMLSMSFMWKSENTVKKLAKTIESTIADDGKIIFFTIDGNAVKQFFNPLMGKESYTLDLNKNNEFVYNREKREIRINLEGTIVSNYVESLVFIEDLMVILGSNYELTTMFQADKDNFMSDNEKMLSRLYSGGIIKKRGCKETFNFSKIETLDYEPVIKASEIKYIPKEKDMTIKESKPPIIFSTETKHEKDEEPLHNLKVGNTDTFEYVKSSWYADKIVRIAVIADGSCFFHGYLNGFYPRYQTMKTVEGRKDLVGHVRFELGDNLDASNSTSKGKKTYYESSEIYTLRNSEKYVNVYNQVVDYSYNGFKRMLEDPTFYIGDEVYSYVANVLGPNIIIMRGTNKDLYLHTKTEIKNRNYVVLIGTNEHYELIGIELSDSSFQTFFPYDHPFILNLLLESKPYPFNEKPQVSLEVDVDKENDKEEEHELKKELKAAKRKSELKTNTGAKTKTETKKETKTGTKIKTLKETVKNEQCKSMTQKGVRCTRTATNGSCKQHQK